MQVCAQCYRTLGDAERACSRDGGAPREVVAQVLPPELLSRFAGIEPFAQSPTSASFLAAQAGGGFRGLLKVIPLRDLDASERGRLKRELRKQVKLAHPNLPRIVDGGELPTDLWLLRDHVDGESLGQRLRRTGPLEFPEAFAVLAQLASALDELHRAGILHRDVRPSRIILQPRDGMPLVKLLDAGIAARQRTGSAFDRLGTPAYMSPEQISGKLVSFRSDLYALGCVFFEMLTGVPPFGVGVGEGADSLRAVLDAHLSAAAPAAPAGLPPAIAAVLASMLDKEPRKRPFSAQQVRRTLDPHLPAGMPQVGVGRSAAGTLGTPLAGALSAQAKGRRSSVPGQAPPARPPREDLTEELELLPESELEAPGGFGDPRTQEIPSEELASLRVDPTLPPSAPEPEPMPEPETQQVPEPRQLQAQELVSAESAVAEPPPSAEPEPPKPEALRRASVAFDVESLFNDPEPERVKVAPGALPTPASANPAQPATLDAAGRGRTPSTSAVVDPDDVAPTLLYEKRDEAAHAAFRAAIEASEAAEPQDRTVVVRRPADSQRGKLVVASAAIGLIILVFALCRGGDDDSDSVAGAATSPAPSAASAAGDSASAKSPSTGVAASKNRDEKPRADENKPDEVGDVKAGSDQAATPAAELAVGGGEGGPAAAEATEAVQPTDATDSGQQAAPARKNAADAVVGQRAARAERVARAEKHKLEARAHYQAGRYREAAKSYELATRETPSDGGAFAGLGASLLAANQPDAAIRAYQRAVQIDGKSSGFHAALGRAYAMKGDRARAKAAFARALQLDPKNGAAKQGLERLK